MFRLRLSVYRASGTNGGRELTASQIKEEGQPATTHTQTETATKKTSVTKKDFSVTC